jgi:hypothetical protein
MSRRTIPLPHLLIKQLAEHKRKQAEQRLKQGQKYHNYNLVFATKDGNPLSRRNLERRNFKLILRNAKLPRKAQRNEQHDRGADYHSRA